MRETVFRQVGESVFSGTLENGLSVYVVPKPEYQQAYATFSTDFGSIDNHFEDPSTGKEIRVPDGIAHFLEHKMFESETVDVFKQFARHAASANAFTSFDITSYLFSSTSDIMENLDILLDFVQDPYFTEENVEKEKGIIGQEIKMYEDNPNWRGFFGLLEGFYHRNPVRIDIAGTVESISTITKDTLYECYRTFYHPANMALVVAGAVDPEVVWDRVVRNQSRKNYGPQPPIKRFFEEEPPSVAKERVECRLPVSMPRCLFGFKDTTVGLRGRALLERELHTALCLDGLFGKSSRFYNRLFEQNLLDQRFSWEYELTPHYGFSIMGGNTRDPEKVLAEANEELESVRTTGLSEKAFERSKKKAIGRFLSALDSTSFLARNVSSYKFKGADLFDTLEVLEKSTLEDANRALQDHLDPKQRSVSLVLPK